MEEQSTPETSPQLEEEEEERHSLLRSFFGLFLVPLIVVLVCVGVFVGFGWIAYDQQTTSDYLNDLKSSWKPRRAQAAYELSRVLVADPSALDDEPGAREEVRTLFAEADEGPMKRYLSLVLGYTKDTEAIPLLVAELESQSSESRIYALWSLGTIGDAAARQPLIESLQDSDPGIRKTAAYAISGLGDVTLVDHLLPILNDAVVDVRWNAALALAELGSPASHEVLLQMIDRRFTDQIPGITPEQQEDAMVGAIRALAKTGDGSARSKLEELASDDLSMKVRQAALDAIAATGADDRGDSITTP
jgi:HEAT repeat protein